MRGGTGWGCANGVGPPPWVVLVSYTACRLKSGSFIDQQSQVCEQEMILKTLEVRTDQKLLTRDTCGAGGGRRAGFGSLPATPLPKLSSFPANAGMHTAPTGLRSMSLSQKGRRGHGLRNQPPPLTAQPRASHTIAFNMVSFSRKKIGTTASPPHPLTPPALVPELLNF